MSWEKAWVYCSL